MASRLIHVVAWSRVSFLPTAGCLWMCWVLLTRSSVDGPLGPVCLLAVAGNAAVNVELQVFECRFQFSWYIPRCLCVFRLLTCFRPPTGGASFWETSKARGLWRPRGDGGRAQSGDRQSRGAEVMLEGDVGTAFAALAKSGSRLSWPWGLPRSSPSLPAPLGPSWLGSRDASLCRQLL